ncbi:septal ring lytic transglycosylase RlpA family protein [Neolewinella litorea]|uniref:septal ring lytic transglycosylase RlpA family protein n=1 Tax=Neolewinella litorea TaxID=2562452 RepID=UPI0014562568|nr:septal ring lytic transglycosylase RlpA family protein [Neolewinella litorea]
MMILLTLLLTIWTAGLSAQLVGDKQSGLASYYSAEYNGAETAYGTIYNKDELVAAHKAYPFNSSVRVTNEENGKSVVVRIIDKGPFIRGRIIELSERAAAELGMLGQRTVPVELTLLSTPDQQAMRPSEPAPARAIPENNPTRDTRPPASPPPPATRAVEPEPQTSAPPPAPAVSAKRTAAPPRRPAKVKTFAAGLYQIALDEPESGKFGVQVGRYSSLESAMDKVAELQGRYFDDILLQKVPENPKGFSYKIILGPFNDQPSAQNYASDLKSRYGIQGFTVELDQR